MLFRSLGAAPDCDQWGVKPPGLEGERGNPFVPEAAEEPSQAGEGSDDESGALPRAESSAGGEATHSASEAESQTDELGNADSYQLAPRPPRVEPVETRAAAASRELRSKANADRNAKRVREEQSNLLAEEEEEEDESVFDFGGAGDAPEETFGGIVWACHDAG